MTVDIQDSKIATDDTDYVTKWNNAIDSIESELNSQSSSLSNVSSDVEAFTGGAVSAVHAMTEAEFRARQEKNKRDYFASGILEYGKHRDDSAFTKFFKGFFGRTDTANYLNWGTNSSTGTGDSATDLPRVLVDGTEIKISIDGNQNILTLPDAPDGTETFNTHTGTHTTHADAATAFASLELIANGEFSSDSSWSKGDGCSIAGGKASFDGSQASTSDLSQTVSATNGEVYGIRFKVERSAGNLNVRLNGQQWGTTVSATGTYVALVTASNIDALFAFRADSSFVGDIYDVSVISMEEYVITNRKDLLFVEQWEELLTTNDMVYPRGCVQNTATTWNSIQLVNNIVVAGYSAYGDWESSPTAGYGLQWSGATDAEKQKFLVEPDNNIYMNEDGNLVQSRWRVRIVKGLGPLWGQIYTDDTTVGISNMVYQATGARVKPQGQLTSLTNDLAADTDDDTGQFAYAKAATSPLPVVGAFTAITTGNQLDTSIAEEGRCFAIPSCLVQRRNIGMYHPVYNPEGAAGCYDNSTFTTFTKWWESGAYQPTSTADCFVAGVSGTSNGYADGDLNSSNSGRPDTSYYDRIEVHDIEDLRLSVRPVNDLNRMLDNMFLKSVEVADDFRKQGNIPETRFFSSTVASSSTSTSKTLVYLEDDSAPWFDIDSGSELRSKFQDRYATPIGFVVHSSTLYYIHAAGRDGTGHYIYVSNDARDRNVDLTSTFAAGQAFVGGVTFNKWLMNESADASSWTERGGYALSTIVACDIIGDLDNYPRQWTGHIDWQSSDGTQTIAVGETVEAVDGSTGGGTDHNVYLSLTVSGSTDLSAEDYSDTDKWRNLGTVGEFKRHATFPGTPIPINDDITPTSQVPDGAIDDFKLARKASQLLKTYRSTDKGQSWSEISPTLTSSTNTIGLTNEAAANIVICFYQAKANRFDPYDLGGVLAHGKIWASAAESLSNGGHLCDNLTGYVPEGTSAGTHVNGINLTKHVIDVSDREFESAASAWFPEHEPLKLENDTSHGVKILPYLSEVDNYLYLNLIFNQIVYDTANDNWVDSGSNTAADASQSYTQGKLYKVNVSGSALEGKILQFVGSTGSQSHTWANLDVLPGTTEIFNTSTGTVDTDWRLWEGTGWGDDQVMHLIDDEATFTDNNGARCFYGNYRTRLPYFYRDDE